jgi:acyl-CoA synthetase (AMP-forming)/AMP-acid ligase II
VIDPLDRGYVFPEPCGGAGHVVELALFPGFQIRYAVTERRLSRPATLADWPEIEATEQPKTVTDLLRRAAERHPGRSAWRFPSLTGAPYAAITYADLDLAVGRVAGALAGVGVEPGAVVAVMLGNVPQFPLVWLALGRLGAAIVPVNPTYTARELDHVATSAGVSHMVIDDSSLDVFTDAARMAEQVPERHLIIGRDSGRASPACPRLTSLLQQQPVDSLPSPRVEPDALMNIQFTSGTTGLPKGCMLTHRYWVTLGLVASALTGGPQRVLADHPFFYMQNQSYLALTFWAGGEAIVVPGLSRSKFLGWIDEYEIEYAWYNSVLHTAPPSGPRSGRSLKFLGSDGVHGEAIRNAEEQYGALIRDHYASTEVGAGIVVPAERGDLMDVPGAIGFPAPFRESRIVDADLRDLPPGSPGELCVRGPAMMLGYYKEPAVNAQTFFDGGWFRTGDLVSVDTNGCHFFHGRIKDSISRSGENISAVEVEEVLLSIPHVRAAAVVGVRDQDRGQEVKACLVVVPGYEEDVLPATVVEACRRQLAPFKIPRYLEFRSALPMTGSGKVAKAKLLEDGHRSRGTFDRVKDAWQ